MIFHKNPAVHIIKDTTVSGKQADSFFPHKQKYTKSHTFKLESGGQDRDARTSHPSDRQQSVVVAAAGAGIGVKKR